MSFPFSMQVWGNLRSNRRALLLHGGVESATSWSRVAAGLVENGYRVDAPDLDGRGWTRETNPNRRYTSHAHHIAENLEPDASYDVVAGISLGAMTALYLFPLLSRKPKKLVLVEPFIDAGPAPPIEQVCKMLENPPPVEALMKANHRTMIEASADRLGLLQIHIPALRHLLEENDNLTHDVLPSPAEAQGTVITILAADPAMKSLYPKANAEIVKEKKPHVRVGWVPGSGHAVHKEKPEAILQVILQDGLDQSDVLEPLHVQ